MVTFRKDIHLGKRVPYFPQGEGECWFVDITEQGVATDKLGRKWQLVPFAERIASPAIVITDVTTDPTYGYSTSEYPLINGKRGAVRLVEITEGESDSDLEYKVIKDDIEPQQWTQYDSAIVLKAEGTYRIVARAIKGGSTSLEVISDEFDVRKQPLAWSYSLQSSSLSYGNISSVAGEKLPTLTYSLAKSGLYTDGITRNAEVITPSSSGYTQQLTYSKISGSYITLADTSTGRITYSANTGSSSRTLGTIGVTAIVKDSDNNMIATVQVQTSVVQGGVGASIYMGRMNVSSLSSTTVTDAAVSAALAASKMHVAEELELSVPDSEVGTYSLVVLVPATSTKVGKRWNGVAYGEFLTENGEKTTTVNGATYKIYGDLIMSGGEYKLKADN